MRQLLTKTSLFLLLAGASLMMYFFIVDYAENKTANNGIFVFGDSQTYQGLDLNTLHTEFDLPIYSAARHGAGVYDFLVFTKYVPDNAKVIVGFSKSMLLREKEKDFNQLGLSASALIDLKKNGYSIAEIREIAHNNLLPKKVFRSSHNLYPNNTFEQDSLIQKIKKSYTKLFSETPDYLNDKMALLETAMLNLKNKNCTVVIIGFPYHEELVEIESSSKVGRFLNQFEDGCIAEYLDNNTDTLWLNDNVQNMYDMTHLNTQAAQNASSKIVSTGFEKNIYISINGGIAH
ncbi:MAG: hypothetical protein N4A46_10120 [Schleiferiaceae bacterium]|jgi:hypothetical protein|nr:hypothetical protein [Schleiferiaceae bacterium]